MVTAAPYYSDRLMTERARHGLAQLSGRRALVIGGSGGIGRAVARGLAKRGADLFLTGGSDASRLAASLKEMRGLGIGAEGRLVNISRISNLVEMLPELGSIDILVCAFGPFLQKALDSTSAAEWTDAVLLNLALPGSLASALLPGMVARSWGRMVFFGGTGTDGIRAYRTNAAYAAAKTGLGVLAKSLAAEYADRNIAAFVVCPGLVDTEYLTSGLRAELAAKSPRSTLLPADDIGECAAGLAAADPCIASGGVFSFDGGLGFRKMV